MRLEVESDGEEILQETAPVGYELPKFKVELGEDFDWTPYVYHYDEDEEDRTGWDEINWNELISQFMREVRESRVSTIHDIIHLS